MVAVLPETKYVWTRLSVDTTRILSIGGYLPLMRAAGDRPEFYIKPPIGGYLPLMRTAGDRPEFDIKPPIGGYLPL